MDKKSFVFYEKYIDVFHNEFYSPTIEKLSFNLARDMVIGSI